MKTLTRILSITGIAVITLIIGFFIYANLEAPSPGERIYMNQPTGIAVLELGTPADEHTLAEEIDLLAGATSHTYAPGTNTLVITYSRNSTDKQSIVSSLCNGGIPVAEKILNSDKPQCPVHGYLDFFL